MTVDDSTGGGVSIGAAGRTYDRMWADLSTVGRHPATGGYRRYAWTREDAALREWFAAEAGSRGLDLIEDRAGNQWAWWGDPDADGPGVAVGSHLDSVPDGGAYDGPLGVVSGFVALDALRADGFRPGRPIAVVNFGDEEGARFGVACAGSRIVTGLLDADRARRLTDADGVSMAQALGAAGRIPADIGPDPDALRRLGAFVELHIEQGIGLADTDHPVAIGSNILPHGRWMVDLPGIANHAGTTRIADRRDPMVTLAGAITLTRDAAVRHGVLATIGRVIVEPNAVNAIPSRVRAWLDARGLPPGLQATVTELTEMVVADGGRVQPESWTPDTAFDPALRNRLGTVLPTAPILATGAGHDAGVLAQAGIPTAMLFVRNPTGISHSPAEFAERDDCLAGTAALTRVLTELAGCR